MQPSALGDPWPPRLMRRVSRILNGRSTMAWAARHNEIIRVPRGEKKLYASRDVRSAYRDFHWPHRKGINVGGEFPVVVVRKAYDERGYDCWISAQSKHGVPSYLLERMPGKRRLGDRAYLKMIEVFGSERLAQLHVMASGNRRAHGLRSAGGDPDLFVQCRGNQLDRFFVEVKLEDLTGFRPYRDKLNQQQLILFPLIEHILACDVRLATVSLQASRIAVTG